MPIKPRIAVLSRMNAKPLRTLSSGDSFLTSEVGAGRARMRARQKITLRKLRASIKYEVLRPTVAMMTPPMNGPDSVAIWRQEMFSA